MDPSRRGILLVGVALPGLLVVRTGRVSPPPEILDHFRTVADRLEDAFPKASPAGIAQAVRREVPMVRAMLAEGNVTTRQKRQLHAAAGRLTALLGNAQLDTGWNGEAARTAARAHTHAMLAEDRTTMAWARLLQASIEQTEDYPHAALEAALDGLEVAPAGSPVAARLWVEVAAAQAKLGYREKAASALNSAWEIVDGLPPDQRGAPGYHPRHVAPAELENDSARIYVHAGNPDAALLHAQVGITALDGSDALGHKAYIRTEAARALLAQREVEHGATYMREALEVCNGRKLTGIGDRARAFVRQARDTAPGPAVESLADYLRDWLATAPA